LRQLFRNAAMIGEFHHERRSASIFGDRYKSNAITLRHLVRCTCQGIGAIGLMGSGLRRRFAG
jgi:hypothetical protein